MMTLILGGSGSGKSAYAEDYLLRAAGDKKKYYIATMQIRDAEMQAKVDRHHRLRQGKGFTTIEQSTALEQAVLQMEPAGAALLECMSNLTANEMFSGEQPVDRQTVITKILQGMEGFRKQADPLVIVTNNVFEDGIIYDDPTMEYIAFIPRGSAAALRTSCRGGCRGCGSYCGDLAAAQAVLCRRKNVEPAGWVG